MRHFPFVSDMPVDTRPVTVEMLAVPEVSASVLYGMHDVFASAGRDWPLLVEGRETRPPFEVRVVARHAEPMEVANGVSGCGPMQRWASRRTSFACPR